MSFAVVPRTSPASVDTTDAQTGKGASRSLAARIAIRHLFDIVMPPLKMLLPGPLALRWNLQALGGSARAFVPHLGRYDSAQIGLNWTAQRVSRTVAPGRNRV